MAQGFDYVIVGGGSSGCVLAARLSENPAVSVCLVEAGGRDSHPYIHMPVGFAKMTTGPLTWGLVTTPQKHANNREILYAQAKVLGGGSSINAEVFTRGHPSDYDRWAEQEGAEGWAYKDIQKYFLRSEGNTVFSGVLHGTDGPLGVSNIPEPNAMTLAFVRSCQENGIPYNPDFNGARQEGAGVYQTTTRNNRRCSASVGYLRPALGRPNLTVITGALVLRLLIEGRRAVGVEIVQGAGVTQVRAESEVLVTSGAIGTPKLMMLSGLGPSDHLRALGIEVKEHLPGVGQNLNDHFGVDIVAELKGHDSLDKYNKFHWMAWAGIQYALFRSGPVTSNVVEGGAFWYSSRHDGAPPDIQFHFLAGAGAEAGVPSGAEGRVGCHPQQLYAQAEGARNRDASLRRSQGQPRCRSQFSGPSRRSQGLGRGRENQPRDLQPAVAAEIHQGDPLSRRQCPEPGRLRGLYPAIWPDLLSPDLHLQDGQGRNVGRRSRAPGARHRCAEDLRQFGHAVGRRFEHQCGDDHDR